MSLKMNVGWLGMKNVLKGKLQQISFLIKGMSYSKPQVQSYNHFYTFTMVNSCKTALCGQKSDHDSGLGAPNESFERRWSFSPEDTFLENSFLYDIYPNWIHKSCNKRRVYRLAGCTGYPAKNLIWMLVASRPPRNILTSTSGYWSTNF